MQVKYTLLDEVDICLIHQYQMEAKVEVDPDGCGAAVYAWAKENHREGFGGQYLHRLVWCVYESSSLNYS